MRRMESDDKRNARVQDILRERSQIRVGLNSTPIRAGLRLDGGMEGWTGGRWASQEGRRRVGGDGGKGVKGSSSGGKLMVFPLLPGGKRRRDCATLSIGFFFLPHAATEMEAIGGDQRSGVKRTGRTRLK